MYVYLLHFCFNKYSVYKNSMFCAFSHFLLPATLFQYSLLSFELLFLHCIHSVHNQRCAALQSWLLVIKVLYLHSSKSVFLFYVPGPSS